MTLLRLWTQRTNVALAAATVCALASGALAQHDVYLETPNTVPSYCQETSIWCGAATAQMILEGYPGGVEHAFSQTYIWNRIQVHKDDPGVNWATDPDGLKDTLMELGGDPGVSWSIFANASAQTLTHSVTYWMTNQEFPTAVLVYGFQHWVMIDGFTTDADPTQQSTVTLQYIEIVDPWNPPCPAATSGGVRSLMSGSNWYANYWYSPGNIAASKWDGNYIAVVEPPPSRGMATAPKQMEKGRVISAERAREAAMRAFKELRVERRAPYSILRRSKPLHSLLVNQQRKGYYIVTLGYQEGGFCQGAVLVNAYDGEFQEVGVFEKPLQYLSEDQAVRRAVSYLCACDAGRKEIRANLVFEPSEQTQTRFLPVWKIAVRESTVYVTQDGAIFDLLTPLPLGD